MVSGTTTGTKEFPDRAIRKIQNLKVPIEIRQKRVNLHILSFRIDVGFAYFSCECINSSFSQIQCIGNFVF